MHAHANDKFCLQSSIIFEQKGPTYWNGRIVCVGVTDRNRAANANGSGSFFPTQFPRINAGR